MKANTWSLNKKISLQIKRGSLNLTTLRRKKGKINNEGWMIKNTKQNLRFLKLMTRLLLLVSWIYKKS